MKVIEENFEEGVVKVKVKSKIDLWRLENIIEPGDFVAAKTLRTIFLQREDRKEKTKRKMMILKIRVEKIIFKESANKLRLIGKIIKCPKDVQKGSYHTIEVGIRDRIKIEKKWTEEQRKMLERSKHVVKISEGKLIQEFFMHLNKRDNLAVYGIEQIRIAADIGAVRIALIAQNKIRSTGMKELIEKIEEKRGEIKLISSKSKLGEDFNKSYGLAAILRFPIS